MYKTFSAPTRLLLGPGPSPVSPATLRALSQPTIGHLDPAFVGLMDEIKSHLQYAFQTENELTMAVSAPGSAGMETCFANLVERGDKVIVCVNGVFGQRMVENVIRCGGVPIVLESEWGTPVDVEALEDALLREPDAKIVAFVHAETSTGVVSDAYTIGHLAHEYDCLSICDAVTSLGGTPLLVDEWRLDAVYSGSQKCLSCVPGLSPVTFSPRAVEVMKARQEPVQSWFLDQSLVLAYWSGKGKRAYHHTAPVNSLYALHETLVALRNETLESAWARHQLAHDALRVGLEALGISFIVEESCRLPQLNTIAIPEGCDDAFVRERLLNVHGIEIGAGLGQFAGKAWRIGLMGYGAYQANVEVLLSALGEVMVESREREAALES